MAGSSADAGESSLGICLSKPLMRLGKLPLLMQALLYHTGAFPSLPLLPARASQGGT